MKKLAISIGDLNGVGLEIALRAHREITKVCKPIYCINENMLAWGSALLGLDVPEDFEIRDCGKVFEITPGICCADAGESSYDSFITAVALAKSNEVDAIVTLPINKEAWEKAGLEYKGHTDALSDLLGCEAIMMLGCEAMFVILYTHHIPLRDVPHEIKTKKLKPFLLKIYEELGCERIAVLGLNPHAGDHGVIGDEDSEIEKAIQKANHFLEREVFFGPMVPDTAFSTANREKFKYFVCMYHDQGLIPLKTLYFEESINVSLNAGIIRTSVDHGTAFDIAYKNAQELSTLSYVNAVHEALKLTSSKVLLTF
ncbi:4-hydroxythreonine-4-phosphate dehydrogenase [Sulfurospirillum sp. hDNRA2]|uniref:4-hydroxythreonine-4-phosphate dehydrogenase n=1 Tax=Sulfurospirillum sp. hDNRA2 TaxID=3237298 RepID=UPI0020B87103|nr:4-hydroxythreonine-4-phosphate dehydrogenase [Sulfurospirillum sp. DNRA8]MCP3651168.1 4-hydroxythreonine-4-phosphate dehydrogenase [Sulfurospirillum sp. DNRA8]MCR1810014.1 4-hydroxythreonine-4-phosphate dehydrogenase [Sulfurospirillum sp. DNRA8]